jgi:hypothetical protein
MHKGLKVSSLTLILMVIRTTPLLALSIMDSKVTPCNFPLALPLPVDILLSPRITCLLKLLLLVMLNMPLVLLAQFSPTRCQPSQLQ